MHTTDRTKMSTGIIIAAVFLQSTLSSSFLSTTLSIKTKFSGRHQICRSRAFPSPLHIPFVNQLSVVLKESQEHAKVAKLRKKKGTKKFSKDKNPINQAQTWRIFGVEVHPDRLADFEDIASKTKRQHTNDKIHSDVPPEKLFLNLAVIEALMSRLKLSSEALDENNLPSVLQDTRIVRRSLDARPNKIRSDGGHGPRFVYVMDIDVAGDNNKQLRLKHQPGRMELLSQTSNKENEKDKSIQPSTPEKPFSSQDNKKRVIIVGAGPAGLFCALQLARTGEVTPILLERGQPVESRGKDIGALMHRRAMNTESNFAFGEGGAGTWSDGKLTTRIGRNSEAVRHVLETFVEFGAPSNILVEGAPHLGTDNLVRLLRNMRMHLRELGGQIHFGTKVTGFIMEDGAVQGVKFDKSPVKERNVDGAQSEISENFGTKTSGTIYGDAVVLATGHSARDVYLKLHEAGVKLEAKGFAAGFRVEHPQKLINKIQYGSEWAHSVVTGKETTDMINQEYLDALERERDDATQFVHHEGKLPVPSYRLATDKAFDGIQTRGVYSFCMCPGGQIVPASTDPNEICVNGMSFSRRDSLWANSALVVTVAPDDVVLDSYRKENGVLAGVAFQRDMERRASEMGGGNLTVPVQRLTDFLAGRPSTSAPSSSYRLGVRPAACHEIYPRELMEAMRDALTNHFEKQMPGFICEEALLHAVETRTSSPVRVSRDENNMQAIGAKGLFPAGEGAGFAGGIVSAAVDGMVVSEAVLENLVGKEGNPEGFNRKSKKIGAGSFY